MADKKLNELTPTTVFDMAYVESNSNQYRITKADLGKQITNEVHAVFSEVSDDLSHVYGLKNGNPIKITKDALAKLLGQINEKDDTKKYFNNSGGIYESVDLGLPSGRKWAKHNIGATKDTEFGSFFAWGATSPYREGIDSTGNNESGNYVDSYANTIQDSTLFPSDDAATVNWGKGWRMPDKTDFEELLAGTYNCWGSKKDGDKNVNGRFFYKTKDDAHKGKRDDASITELYNSDEDVNIFIPAAGYLYGLSHYNVGSSGGYWSRSRSSAVRGWRLYFLSGYCGVDSYYRFNGFSVRPVRV